MQLLDSCPLPQAQFASLSILLQLHLNDNEDYGVGSSSHNTHRDDSHPKIIQNVSSGEIESESANNNYDEQLNNNNIEMVECRTSNGTHKQVPLYPKGMTVYYKNASLDTKTPATIVDVHMDDLLEPYYTIKFKEDGREKQTDNSHLRLENVPTAEEGADEDEGDNAKEADKSAGPPANNRRTSLQYAVLKESLTVISPLTILPEGACNGSMESLQYNIMEEFGLRDDFEGVGGVNNDNNDNDIGGDDNFSDKENAHDDNNNEDVREVKTTLPEDDNTTRRGSSRVRFHDDTKEGAAMQDPPPAVTDANTSVSKDESFGSDSLLVKTYKPPRHHLNCSLGVTLFYVAVYVEDVSKYVLENDDSKNNASREKRDADDGMKSLLKNCASVLLPGIPLSSLIQSLEGMNSRKQSGIILLTVGITGPAYDLYGYSSVIATLPQRLRESIATLSMVDTTPKVVKAANNYQLQQSLQQLQQSPSSKKKKQSKGGGPDEMTMSLIAAAQATQPTTITYDSAYFQRLYMALLATMIDDEDGLLRDHDEIVATTTGTSESYNHIGTSSSQLLRQGQQSLTDSNTGLLANQSVTSSGTVKKKRFTFSRSKKSSSKKNSSAQGYESGDMISGGDDPLEEVGKTNAAAVSSSEGTEGINNAEIVRRTAQQLEVLSLVEDDMDLPKYSHANNDGHSRGSGLRRIPSSPIAARSPRRANAASASGRFGRMPVPSDLAGFEYRSPSQHQHHIHGGMSVSGTASTSVMGNSASDNVSVGSGDDTATTSSKFTIGSSSLSFSSVPTLSKSKRDSSLSTTRKSSRSRFLQRKRKDKKSTSASSPASLTIEEDVAVEQATTAKPPLFPQQQHQFPPSQPVFNPFSMDDDIGHSEYPRLTEDYHHESFENDSRTDQSETATQSSMASVSTKDSVHTPMTPKSPEGGIGGESVASGAAVPSSPLSPPTTPQEVKVVASQTQGLGTISRSFSEEESVEAMQSMPESATSIPESPVASPPKEEAAAILVEPTRYLDVGLALNEDLTCEYHRSRLSSLTVEGTVQVRVKTRYEEGEEPSPQQQQQPMIPFFLVFQDHSGHIKALQENKKFVENVTHEGDVANREFTYTIKVPREEEYFPVVRYKCGNSLRPVPIVSPTYQ